MEPCLSKATVEKLYAKGVISQKHVSQKVMSDILARMDAGKLDIISNFHPSHPPKVHDGVSICVDCGEIYWVTPSDDAYTRGDDDPQEKGKVCQRCLLYPSKKEG
jgi:hypothetical protein